MRSLPAFSRHWTPRTIAQRYLFAVLACAVAALATSVVLGIGERHPISALLAAILLSGWYGGAGPAILALVLSILLDRGLPLALGYPDTLWIGVWDIWFFTFAIASAAFGSARRKMNIELESARQSLQELMLERTNDLRRKENYLAVAEGLGHLGSWSSPMDPDGDRYWSAEFYRNLGLEPFSVKPSTQLFWSFVHPEDRDQIQQRVANSVAQLKRFDVEHRIVRSDGTVRTVYGVGQPYVVDGTAREYIGVMMDVTELRAAESLERRSRERAMRARFAARLSERNRLARELHDTLLQGFTGVSLQLLAATRAIRGRREDVAALEHVLSLAEQTLADARRAIFDLREPSPDLDLPASLRELVEATLRGTDIAACFEVVGSPRRVARRARHAILRIVGEATMNAVKHSGARQVRVLLHFAAAQVRVEITDDGRGFAFAEAQSENGHYGLMGMRERTNRLGGTLHVMSQPGHGTTICFVVPRRRARPRRGADRTETFIHFS